MSTMLFVAFINSFHKLLCTIVLIIIGTSWHSHTGIYILVNMDIIANFPFYSMDVL